MANRALFQNKHVMGQFTILWFSNRIKIFRNRLKYHCSDAFDSWKTSYSQDQKYKMPWRGCARVSLVGQQLPRWALWGPSGSTGAIEALCWDKDGSCSSLCCCNTLRYFFLTTIVVSKEVTFSRVMENRLAIQDLLRERERIQNKKKAKLVCLGGYSEWHLSLNISRKIMI